LKYDDFDPETDLNIYNDAKNRLSVVHLEYIRQEFKYCNSIIQHYYSIAIVFVDKLCTQTQYNYYLYTTVYSVLHVIYSAAQAQRRTRLHLHNYVQQKNLLKVDVAPCFNCKSSFQA